MTGKMNLKTKLNSVLKKAELDKQCYYFSAVVIFLYLELPDFSIFSFSAIQFIIFVKQVW